MTSKWIKEIEKAIDNQDLFESYIEHKLHEIDKLLRESVAGTDNENLADRIRKEIKSE